MGWSERRRVLVALAGVAAVGVALVVVANTGHGDGSAAADDLAQCLAAIAAWLSCRSVGRRQRDGHRMWRLAGRAALTWGIGEAALTLQQLAFDSTRRPSPADLAFVVAATYAVRAPMSFPSAPARIAARSRVLLDGLIVAASVLFLIWVVVLHDTTPSSGVVAQLAYPLVDIVVISLVVAALARAERSHAISLILAAVGLFVLAGTNLAEAGITVLHGGTRLVYPADVGFVLGLTLVGSGAVLDGVGVRARLERILIRAQSMLPHAFLPLVIAVAFLKRHALGDRPVLMLVAIALFLSVRQVLVGAENAQLLSEHRDAMNALADSEQRYRRIVETASEGIWVSSADGITNFVNPRALEMLGFPEDIPIVGRPTVDILDDLLDDEGREEIRRRMSDRAAGLTSTYEFRLRRTDGSTIHTLVSASPLYDADGQYEGSLTMISDITARKELETRLSNQARTDALTGLGNRMLLTELSEETLATTGAALVYCDLDGFKGVNDSLGHSTGDVLLREVAHRLRGCLRPGDVIVRLGGDEFAALLPGVTEARPAQAVAQRMLDALSAPFGADGRSLYVAASIGIAVAQPGGDFEQLLRSADLAMYAAKGDGRGRHRVFEDKMHRAVTRRLELEQDLRHALETDELQVWFQPVLRLSDGVTTGAEALVRWTHPVHGPLGPDEFIPIAEDTGLVSAIGRRVLELATAEAARWEREFGLELAVSVNVSARHLIDGTVIADVAGALAMSALPAERLLVEITERSLLGGQSARASVAALREFGCGLALDDFGTGYSSIAHLRDFPVAVLKLDRSFVSTMTTDLHSARLVQAILGLARTLGISCTAEGVETHSQARRLLAGGCRYAQGHLYAPALAPKDFDRWLRERRPRPAVPQQREAHDDEPAHHRDHS